MFEPSSRLICCTCALLILMGIPDTTAVVPGAIQAQKANQPDGIVIGLAQELTDGTRQLSLGSQVRVGAKISPVPNTAHEVAAGSLTVWFEGYEPTIYPCTPGRPKECKVPLEIYSPVHPSTPAPKSLKEKVNAITQRLMEVAAFALPEEPSRYFSAASRGLEGEAKEAVALLQDSQVDIADALTDLSAGTYFVRIESLGQSAQKTNAVQVRWQPGKQALVPAAGRRPGLYRFTLLESADEPGGSEAWILFSTAQNYATDLAAFQGVQDTVAAWPKSADPVAIRGVLRASLEALSKQKGSAVRR